MLRMHACAGIAIGSLKDPVIMGGDKRMSFQY